MNAQGLLTSAVAETIRVKMKKKNYDLYYDHKKDGKLTGTIAVSFEGKTKGKLGKEEEISQTDIAVVEENFRQDNVDLSSLSSMLQARWKGGQGGGGPKGEGPRNGQIRSFRISKLDAAAKKIELELV